MLKAPGGFRQSLDPLRSYAFKVRTMEQEVLHSLLRLTAARARRLNGVVPLAEVPIDGACSHQQPKLDESGSLQRTIQPPKELGTAIPNDSGKETEARVHCCVAHERRRASIKGQVPDLATTPILEPTHRLPRLFRDFAPNGNPPIGQIFLRDRICFQVRGCTLGYFKHPMYWRRRSFRRSPSGLNLSAA